MEYNKTNKKEDSKKHNTSVNETKKIKTKLKVLDYNGR